jgi:glutamate/tyrosine decarboxylase-like PLP-dependent enzyme
MGTDAHKYLNVAYDAGIALVRNPSALERELSVAASYLPEGKIGRAPCSTPPRSRAAPAGSQPGRRSGPSAVPVSSS